MKQTRAILRRVTNACWLGLFFLIHNLTPCFGESYWDGLVNYNPPIPMWGGTEAGNAGLPTSGFELRSEGTTNGYGQVTEKYLIEIRFDAASNDKLALISYAKVRDPQKAAAAADSGREALSAQIQPLALSEAQAILQRHTDQGKLKWGSAGDKRWKRSDGAMAALTKNGLTIATAEMWPRLRLNE